VPEEYRRFWGQSVQCCGYALGNAQIKVKNEQACFPQCARCGSMKKKNLCEKASNKQEARRPAPPISHCVGHFLSISSTLILNIIKINDVIEKLKNH
jgi:hypothetical protein